MKELIRGGNAVIATAGIVHIALAWKSTRHEVDAICFGIGADERVLSEAWFIFYNQPRGPAAAVVLSRPSAQEAEFTVDLDGLPAAIEKCVFAAVIEESGSFRDIPDAIIVATPAYGEKVAFRMTEQADERALIFAELYRHETGWKLRAVGQGFKGGLEPLARHYGVQIADENADQGPPPPSESISQEDNATAEPPSPAASSEPTPSRWPKRLGLLALLLGIAGIAVYYLLPYLSTGPRPSSMEQTSLPEGNYPIIDDQNCTLSVDELFSRYHTLGENYLKTREIVTDSNQVRIRLTRNWREADFACTQGFLDASQREIDRLRNIPIKTYFQEATQLNFCAGQLLSQIERDLGSETRPALLQRLMRDADRGRNLESDLTNIARDLAFYDDKIERLIAEYRSNIEACSL